MAKSQLFGQNPVLDYIYKHGGVFPVRRGHHDDEAFKTANAILDRGGCVLMYAEGGRSRTGELGEAKPGVGRLALESGVTGGPGRDPRLEGRARRGSGSRFPKVTVQYGEPITFPVVAEPTREQQLEAAREIFEPVKQMYSALEQQGRSGVIKALRSGAADAVAGASATRAQS